VDTLFAGKILVDNVICEIAMSAMHYPGGVLFGSVIQLAVVVRSGAAETASPTRIF
jgi:hypothetical protein